MSWCCCLKDAGRPRTYYGSGVLEGVVASSADDHLFVFVGGGGEQFLLAPESRSERTRRTKRSSANKVTRQRRCGKRMFSATGTDALKIFTGGGVDSIQFVPRRCAGDQLRERVLDTRAARRS